MADSVRLTAPAGTRVTVSADQAEALKAQGWVETDAEPAKRGPGRPRKSE